MLMNPNQNQNGEKNKKKNCRRHTIPYYEKIWYYIWIVMFWLKPNDTLLHACISFHFIYGRVHYTAQNMFKL